MRLMYYVCYTANQDETDVICEFDNFDFCNFVDKSEGEMRWIIMSHAAFWKITRKHTHALDFSV
jgi:hypothetical protein